VFINGRFEAMRGYVLPQLREKDCNNIKELVRYFVSGNYPVLDRVFFSKVCFLSCPSFIYFVLLYLLFY
jgi:hypothetical protein